MFRNRGRWGRRASSSSGSSSSSAFSDELVLGDQPLELTNQRELTQSICKFDAVTENTVRVAEENLRIAKKKAKQAKGRARLQLEAYGKASCPDLCSKVITILPAELRDQIYSYLTDEEDPEEIIANTAYLGKDFSREHTAYLYRTLRFRFEAEPDNPKFSEIVDQLDQHGLRRMDHIRNIVMVVSEDFIGENYDIENYITRAPFLVKGTIPTLLRMKQRVTIEAIIWPSDDHEDNDNHQYDDYDLRIVRMINMFREELDAMRSTGHTVKIVAVEDSRTYVLDDNKVSLASWTANKKHDDHKDYGDDYGVDEKYLMAKLMGA